MSEKKLIYAEDLKAALKYGWVNDRFVLRAIDEAPAVDAMPVNWISTDDEWPPMGVEVLTYDCNKNIRVLTLLSGKWEDDYGYYLAVGDVDFWMPLPQPPMEDQREYEMASDERDYCERYEPTYNSEDGSL